MTIALLSNENDLNRPLFDPQTLIDQFISNIDVKPNSKNTYRRQMKAFFQWVSSRCNFDKNIQLTKQDILAYRDSMIEEGKSAATICNYMMAVKVFFGWLEESELFANIAKKVKPIKKPKGFRKDCLTVDQVREALASFDMDTPYGLRDFAIFNLLIRTGLRTIEICRAKMGDLRQENGQAVLYVQGKGSDSKDEFVLLLPDTLKPLRKYLASRGPLNEKDPLFSSLSKRSKGSALKERSISWIIKTTLRRIDVDDARLTTHSLRHTAISLSVQNGATIMQAQAMARHSDPKTTMIYFHNHDRVKSGAEHFVVF